MNVAQILPYDRTFNFSAGPSCLPVEVLEQARDEMVNFRGSGMSIMEMSHRGKVFESVLEEAIADLRQLIGIPDHFKILFLQGGASLQFSMLAMNFLEEHRSADYVLTGTWGKKAIEAASLVGKTNVIFDSKSTNYDHAPRPSQMNYSENPCYIHFTSNETIQGVDFLKDPQVHGTFVCDMSSNILSRPVNMENYAMIYAGAQKNMGPAGVTLVILREDMLERVPRDMHPMLSYRVHAENDSMYNTPPTWGIYVCGLVYKWLLKTGGLEKRLELNQDKAQVLYDAIDQSDGFYTGHAKKGSRSLMNITFRLRTEEMSDQFVKEAKKEGFDGLKGHRSVGGCRASVYNAFPKAGCEALAEFMRHFAARNG
ncbi:MAG TPA: 3-phosphoserine/phosphohydroxythreonine transaminase [Fimbriimonadaceae bacterium]|nr:3-phosphoserine/phosphohydroxythreonine transaminase [Fimbriimonadaceae bacterium]HRJ32177.1 3-phosphoserine/phosphohydroxythreonine transaminase [Fimbriimonadaceae bacterium]